ncbi:MAG TPA: pilus assembly protein TadG-related protein [Caulobacter sp.]|nr:pilus assembly protein TadG-related protein [Caulobacter sp.]
MRRFAKDARGNVAVLAALTVSLVTAGAGFGVEAGYWFYDTTRLQQAADAAAYAATAELRSGSDGDQLLAAARTAAQDNGVNLAADQIELVTPAPVNGASNERAVSVVIRRTQRRMFSAMFTSTPMVTEVKAVAAFAVASDTCILALDRSASRAVNFAGNTTANFAGCVVMANSLASDAVHSQGSASVTAPCMVAVGGADLTSGVRLACGAPTVSAPPAADPFRLVPEPANTAPCTNGSAKNLTPGRYCNGMTWKNDVTLAPGVYVLSGGELKINANANVSGSGVTIFLTDNANVSINGNATLNLSAPTSGTYAGILFMGSRSNSNIGNTFNGTADSKLTGALYFPKQDVSYLGNFAGQNGCTQVVARTVDWSGNTTFNVDCSALGLKPIVAGGLITLVG